MVATVLSRGRQAPVIWCGVVATAPVAAVSAETGRRGRAPQHCGPSTPRVKRPAPVPARQEAATIRLAEQHLPAAVARLQEGEFAEDVLLSVSAQNEGLSPQSQAAHQALLRSVVEAVQAEESMRDSAQRGVVNIARRVQAIVHQQATDLRGMEDRHGQEPAFFADLLRLDHGTALIGRLADSIAVLGGARPGRQWGKAVPLYSVLRGAMSRILDYKRVELHTVAEVAVVGTAVEPLIHALAELLDNATRYSPPKTRVHLTAVEVHMGIAIEIEDGGIGLSEEARSRAEGMLKEARAGIDLNDLGESPRLGTRRRRPARAGLRLQGRAPAVRLRRRARGADRAEDADHHRTRDRAGARHRRLLRAPAGAAGGRTERAVPGGNRSFRTALRVPARVPEAAATVDTHEAMDAEQPAPARAARTAEEAPAAIERTASGLPQRRRRTRIHARGAFGSTPLPGTGPRRRRIRGTGARRLDGRVAERSRPADKPKAAPSRGNSDTSDEDE